MNFGYILKIIVVPIVVFILPFALPYFHFTFDLGRIFTFISFLFAILLGFFIGAATTNYFRLQTLISTMNANIISAFNLGKLIQPSLAEKLSDVIDRYLIATLDFDLLAWVPNTKQEFFEVLQTFDEISPQDQKGFALLSSFEREKNSLSTANQEILLASKEVIGRRHWFILIALAVLVAVMILELRDGSRLFSFINGIILLALYQALILAKDVDSNLFLAKKMAYEGPQEVFRTIGKLPYYPEIAIADKRVKEPEGSYRIGVYKNYPHSFEKEIKIVQKGTP